MAFTRLFNLYVNTVICSTLRSIGFLVKAYLWCCKLSQLKLISFECSWPEFSFILTASKTIMICKHPLNYVFSY